MLIIITLNSAFNASRYLSWKNLVDVAMVVVAVVVVVVVLVVVVAVVVAVVVVAVVASAVGRWPRPLALWKRQVLLPPIGLWP